MASALSTFPMNAFRTLTVVLQLCMSAELIVALFRKRVTIGRLLFWWRTTGIFLEHLMGFAHYPHKLQIEYLKFFVSYVIPRLGPSPTEYQSHTPRSYMSDDCTPIEFSWAWNFEEDTIRSTFEPLCPVTGSPTSSDTWMKDLSRMPAVCRMPNFDISWAKICFDTLIYQGTSQTPKGHSSQFSIGFDLTRKGVVGKAYFLTHVRTQRTSTSSIDITASCMEQLGLQSQWSIIAEGTRDLQSRFTANPEIIAVDLLTPSCNRAKVYIRTDASSLKSILQLFTLNGKLSSPDVIEASDYIRRLWKCLFGNVDEEFNVISNHPTHYASGFVVYFDLRLSTKLPTPKLYIPVRHYCDDDQSIAISLSTFFNESGQMELSKRYITYMKTLAQRSLSQQAGIQTYFGVGCGKDGPKPTIYLCPEVFTSARSQ